MAGTNRWVIADVGARMACVAIGSIFSLALLLEPWSGRRLSAARGATRDRFGTPIVEGGPPAVACARLCPPRSVNGPAARNDN